MRTYTYCKKGKDILESQDIQLKTDNFNILFEDITSDIYWRTELKLKIKNNSDILIWYIIDIDD